MDTNVMLSAIIFRSANAVRTIELRRDVTMDSAGVRIGSPSIITPTEFVSVFL